METGRMYIDGRWRDAATGDVASAFSPASGAVIGTVAQGDRTDARRAISAARAAAPAWAALTPFERAAHMHAVADLIVERHDALAQMLSLDQGKPLHTEAHDEVDELTEYWRMAAEDAKRLPGELPASVSPGARVMLMRRPRGVVSVISPWNWPYTMPAELIAPALACGNTVVWTPAPSTSICAGALAACIADAGLPPGVLNFVTGPGPVVGDEIARHRDSDGVAFIGSTATGRSVALAAAGKATLLEMGGNGPLVVLADANLPAAVDAAMTACFLCAGQSCTAGERLLVAREVRDEFVARLAARVADTIVLGDPFAPQTTMGPLNNEAVAAKMDVHVADAQARGDRLVCGGSRQSGLGSDLYWQATILEGVPRDALVATEETFGPIAPIVTIDSLADAIKLTNASPYGLLSAIFTADLAAGMQFAEQARSGWVNINQSTNYWEAQLPFGGRAGSDSGLGRVGGAHVMHTFTELQTVVVFPHQG
jgi:acyl-CoA reductase-like NAD-dependent aldehyde dehydrogenase